MKTIIGSIVGLVIVAVMAIEAFFFVAMSTVLNAAEPSAFVSLQPFVKFQKGAGEGVAYSYKPRSKAQFVALLRDPKLAKKEMRVGCDTLVYQMMEAHKGFPFEGCEGAAAAIEKNDDFAIIACEDKMFQQDNWLTVTNEGGSAWGVWHRKCLPNEKVLVYKTKPIISLTCLNVAIPVVPTAIAPPPAVVSSPPPPAQKAVGDCPSGYLLVANAWQLTAMPPDIREKARKFISDAEDRDSRNASYAPSYRPDDVSRTLGARLRKEIGMRAGISAEIRVFYRDPQTTKVVKDLGVIRLVWGIGSLQFQDDPRNYIVETVWPGNFVSPTVSGNERRLWLFPYEWGEKCSMNVHGIIP